MPRIGEAVARELMYYLENEINNRSLMVDVVQEDGEVVTMDFNSACFRDGGPNDGNIEILLEDGPKRVGVSLKFEITDEQEGL